VPGLVTRTAGDASVTVDLDHGGRLATLTVAGHQLLAHVADDPIHWGAYVMAPYAGRVRNGRLQAAGRTCQLPLRMPPHAIHGTVLDRRWRQVGGDAFTTDLGPDWPWPGTVTQVIRLSPDALELTVEVRTDGAAGVAFPASAGWHPWFRRSLAHGHQARLHLSAATMLRRGPDGLPDGTLLSPPPDGPYDDCFTDLRAPTRIEWPGALTLTVESDCAYLVVYDERPDAVCVEPQTAPPNALEPPAFTVTGDTPLRAWTRWSWSPA